MANDPDFRIIQITSKITFTNHRDNVWSMYFIDFLQKPF